MPRQATSIRVLVGFLLVGHLLVLRPPALDAQVGASIVFDPTTFAEVVLLVAQGVEELSSWAESLRQQYQMLTNQARSLASLPMNMANEISAVWTTYTSLLQQARGMSFSLSGVVTQFEALYQTGGSSGDVAGRIGGMYTQVRDAGRAATQVTAIYDRLCTQNTNLQRAMGASGAAVGETSAIQAQTQVLGVMAEQQGSLQELMAANGRLQTSFYVMQNTLAEQAKVERRETMEGIDQAYTPLGQTSGGFTPPTLSY